MKPDSPLMGRFFRLAACLVAGVSVSSAAIAQSNPAVTLNTSQLGTSFDCSRTGQNIPSLVCNDPELRVADLQQMQVYYALRHAAPNRQQELRTQFLSRVQGLVSNCSAENVRASGTQKQCVSRELANMRNFWFGQLQQTGNAAAIEEAQLNVNQLVSVQTSLKNQGLLPANSVADGVYGNMTRDAVTKLQTDRGLSATGFVNAATVQQLLGITSAGNAPQNVVSPQQARQRTSVYPEARYDVALVESYIVNRQYSEALAILQPAAQQQNSEAIYRLAEMFFRGEGYSRSLDDAERLAKAALDLGHHRASELLTEIRELRHHINTRQRHAQQLAPIQSSYRAREKTVLEQIFNYSTTGDTNGTQEKFWISGHNGTHKCVLTPFGSDRNSTVNSSAIDIRSFNQTAFNIRREFILGGMFGLIAGDGQIEIVGGFIEGPGFPAAPSLDRLERGWRFAFQECPGRRSAF
jgi:hypothetical protein